MADDGNESSDAYCSSDEEDLSYVDFYLELDDNVVINTVSTNDLFLNKLCGDNAEFINLVNENVEIVEEDTENIYHVFNVKEGISYKKKELGEDESLKVNKVSTRSRSKSGEGTIKSPKTPVKAITSGEACSESPKWTKSKSLKPEHNCSRNYNLGSLVTYKWIAHHYAIKLIANPFIPYMKMKNEIREKFLINVSLGQCKRAKQMALFYYEGGLREHYGRLWEYRQAILDSNPGSTCRIDDEETKI
nr:chloramphenicol acetyltransferase-like domain-containing protein [Tanacetum cinerariifolium]